ncbi:MAG TPA: hypothetical protein VLI41_02115 [Phenylobacterium sp.]|uniref:hypothetical protein n=1 Tax=Phenylobacterium sp. TaxID=1871053 RepID=UPI002D020614|nr:hypothetical protein [Phenylobacterium sp.]HSV01976.1 hypothetical protein [Phenylobacterium sp.]
MSGLNRLLAGVGAALILAGPAAAQSVIGDWAGSLSLGARSLRLALHVSPAPEGLPNASLESPDQGAGDVSGRVIDQKGATSQILFMEAGADYTATLSPDGKTLTGKWSQGAMSLPLVMTRQSPAAAPAKP